MVLTLFFLGLFGSLHCLGMCGPIALLLPINKEKNHLAIFQILLYNLGRVCTYTLIGVVFGLLGKTFHLLSAQQFVSIFVGLVMIFSILFPKIISQLQIGTFYTKFILKLKNAFAKALKKSSKNTFFSIGLLNGFLPCGLVYVAILTSLTASNALEGGLLMMVFGLGTIPLMVLIVFANQLIPTSLFAKARKAIPVFIVLVGLLFVLRGLGLDIPLLSPNPNLDKITNSIHCN